MQEKRNKTPEELETSRTVATMLVVTGAVKVDIDRPKRFHSGIWSPIFTDCSDIFKHTGERDLIIKLLIGRIQSSHRHFDAVMGVPSGADPFAFGIADRLGAKYVKINEKKDKVEGLDPGDTVEIIEDVVTSGKSTRDAVNRMRKAGGKAGFVTSISSYGLEEADTNLAEDDLVYTSLTDIDAIYEALKITHKISQKDAEILEEWMQNPRAWKPNQT